MPAFADANYYIALLSPRDRWRDLALAYDALNPANRTATTDFVLAEVFAYFAGEGPLLRTACARLVDRLRKDDRVTLVHHTPDLFLEGVELYRRRLDKGYSLTDCISMVVCRRLRITQVLTHDKHFEQEGFVRLLA
ncbi:MAG TPA: nucleic acid-binding protein [Dehalococcoidia bacterium]|nr:nucleic acid-binding protein [Dehalococcoidia bacterium]